MSLKGRVAVVTGATGALGRVAVRAFLENGAYVVSTYRSEEKHGELVEFVGEARNLLAGVQADVTDEVSVQALLQNPNPLKSAFHVCGIFWCETRSS